MTGQPSAHHQIVVFSLGSEEYAAPITRVQEIINYTEPRSVASSVPWLRGVISLRGRVLPVCDLATRLGEPARPVHGCKIVIVEAAGETAGIVVDDVAEVLSLEEAALEEVPVADQELVEAVVKIGDRLVVLLNLDGVFAGAQLAAGQGPRKPRRRKPATTRPTRERIPA